MLGYNFREHINYFGGSFLGCVLPVAALRYSMFPPESKTFGEEALKWCQAGASLQGFFSISLGGFLGAKWGGRKSDEMKIERLETDLMSK